MKNFHPILDKRELRRRTGSMTQVAGLRRCVLADGRMRGVEAVNVRTGAGLEYTVLPGRGMDIAWTSYRGVPVSYMSSAGVSAADSYEPEGMEWLRGFYAGMLTTCGLTNVGGPCEETHPVIGRRQFGLHGRLSYLQAGEVGLCEEWTDAGYEMRVSGKLRESIVHGENLTLRRELRSIYGSNRIEIRDVIENEGNQPQPMMLLYHMNIGHPILSEHAKLYAASARIEGGSELAQAELSEYDCFHAPIALQEERCYFHKPIAGADGKSGIAVVNEELELGVLFVLKPEQLPCVTEWKMLSEGEYVLGIEPGNTHPIGRTAAREQGALCMLEPDEQREVELGIEILDGREAIDAAKAWIEGLRR